MPSEAGWASTTSSFGCKRRTARRGSSVTRRRTGSVLAWPSTGPMCAKRRASLRYWFYLQIISQCSPVQSNFKSTIQSVAKLKTLLSCPHCGKRPKADWDEHYSRGGSVANCYVIQCCARLVAPTKFDAEEKWNKRRVVRVKLTPKQVSARRRYMSWQSGNCL